MLIVMPKLFVVGLGLAFSQLIHECDVIMYKMLVWIWMKFGLNKFYLVSLFTMDLWISMDVFINDNSAIALQWSYEANNSLSLLDYVFYHGYFNPCCGSFECFLVYGLSSMNGLIFFNVVKLIVCKRCQRESSLIWMYFSFSWNDSCVCIYF